MVDERKTIELGGRKFLAVGESTLEHDLQFMGLITQAEIEKIVQAEDEPTDVFAKRILDTLLASGKVIPILGCLLIPEADVPRDKEPGDIWTPRHAELTQEFVAGLRETKDKEVVHSLILSVLISFFERGIVSLWTSRTSSSAVPPHVPGSEKKSATEVFTEAVDGSGTGGNS